MQPVLQAGAVDMLSEEVRRGDLGEDEEGVGGAVADLGGEADLGEGLDELDEGGFCLGALWGLLVRSLGGEI